MALGLTFRSDQLAQTRPKASRPMCRLIAALLPPNSPWISQGTISRSSVSDYDAIKITKDGENSVAPVLPDKG